MCSRGTSLAVSFDLPRGDSLSSRVPVLDVAALPRSIGLDVTFFIPWFGGFNADNEGDNAGYGGPAT